MGRLILSVLAGVGWLYYWMPGAVRRGMSRALGFLLCAIRLRAKVVEQNLEIAAAAPEPLTPAFRTEEARRKIFRASYDSLASLTFEILMLFGPMRRFILNEVELVGGEHWIEAKKRGKGVLFLSNHVGNWEVMAGAGALHQGMDLMLVTKHLKPEWLHQAIEKGRARCGVSATYEPKTLRDVLAHLKRNGTVGFVLDQYAGPPVGVRVPVFGMPVGTTSAVAMLAKRTGAAVLPVVNYRRSDGKWRVHIRPPIEWESAGSSESGDEAGFLEIARNTARYALEMEGDIYRHPEQWLWIHRRFKGDLSPLRPDEWKEGRARR